MVDKIILIQNPEKNISKTYVHLDKSENISVPIFCYANLPWSLKLYTANKLE